MKKLKFKVVLSKLSVIKKMDWKILASPFEPLALPAELQLSVRVIQKLNKKIPINFQNDSAKLEFNGIY